MHKTYHSCPEGAPFAQQIQAERLDSLGCQSRYLSLCLVCDEVIETRLTGSDGEINHQLKRVRFEGFE